MANNTNQNSDIRDHHKMKQLILVAFFMVTGCAGLAGGNSACKFSSDDQQVAELMQKGCNGDPFASFQLGEIYEQRAKASNNDMDWSHALNFYQIAAQPHSGQTFIYIPGAGKVSGYTMPVQNGTATLGIAEAQFRLGQIYLNGRGVKPDAKTALRYLDMAAAQGHEGARLLQRQLN